MLIIFKSSSVFSECSLFIASYYVLISQMQYFLFEALNYVLKVFFYLLHCLSFFPSCSFPLRGVSQMDDLCTPQKTMLHKKVGHRIWGHGLVLWTGGLPDWTVRQCVLSHVRLSVTLWAVAHWAPLSVGFFKQEYWSGLPFPPPGEPS